MDILYLSIIVAIAICVLVLCLKYLHLLRWISGQAYVLSKPHDALSAEEVLDLLKTTKPFPVSCQKGWTIHSFHHGLRVWFHFLIMQNSTTKVYGSFTRVRASAQVVLQMLRDVSVTREWKPGVVTTSVVRASAAVDGVGGRGKGSFLPVQHDLVKEEYVLQARNRGLDSLWQAHVTHTCTVEISRYWHREDNGVCWHLQVDETDQAWLFLLAQPVEELDHCVVTVVMGFGATYRLASPPEMVAMTLGSLDNFIRNRRLQMTPLTTITLPSQQPVLDDMAAGESQDIPRKREAKIMTKFRSLLEKSPSIGSKMDVNNLQRYSSILRYQAGSRDNFGSREPSLDSVEGVLTPDKEGAQEGGGSAESSEEGRGNSRGRAHSESESGSPFQRQRSESPADGVDSAIVTRYRLMANQAAAELLAQVVQASNIELDRPAEEQMFSSGGWMFTGCENDVIILKKCIQDGSTVQCYMGKGLVHAPPQTVWEAVKNPRTRFTYDESLKKIDVLQSIGDGMKIVYLYHEVVQLLKKETCDICLLQSQRTEGEKYILAYQSVDDVPKCPQPEGVIRARLLPSGWIIEPAKKDRKVYSMVTYLMQMDFGAAKPSSEQLPFEQMASKQPISISFLQQYLKPAVLLARQKSSPAARIP